VKQQAAALAASHDALIAVIAGLVALVVITLALAHSRAVRKAAAAAAQAAAAEVARAQAQARQSSRRGGRRPLALLAALAVAALGWAVATGHAHLTPSGSGRTAAPSPTLTTAAPSPAPATPPPAAHYTVLHFPLTGGQIALVAVVTLVLVFGFLFYRARTAES
jgi:hypothetical protein